MAFIRTSVVEKGDLIRVRRKKGYFHFGIAISPDRVIHFTGDNSDSVLNSKGVMVRETDLSTFLRNDKLEVQWPYDSDFARDIVVERAKEFLGMKVVLGGTYNLVTNNCEHFARYCYYDEHQSVQVETVVKVVKGAIEKVEDIIENRKMKKNKKVVN